MTAVEDGEYCLTGPRAILLKRTRIRDACTVGASSDATIYLVSAPFAAISRAHPIFRALGRDHRGERSQG